MRNERKTYRDAAIVQWYKTYCRVQSWAGVSSTSACDKLPSLPTLQAWEPQASRKTTTDSSMWPLEIARDGFAGSLSPELQPECLFACICRLFPKMGGTLLFNERYYWFCLLHPHPPDCHVVGNTKLHPVWQKLPFCLLHFISYPHNIELYLFVICQNYMTLKTATRCLFYNGDLWGKYFCFQC